MKRSKAQRCGARNKQVVYVTKEGGTRIRSPHCRAWALPGKTRCRLHGGLSTGPTSAEGKIKVVSAMVEGRRAWVERMKAEGKKFPGGRKPGAKWVTPKMRAREALAGLMQEAQAAEASREALASISYGKRVDAAKSALRALQEQLDRTGSFFG